MPDKTVETRLAFEVWFASLKKYRNGIPALGTIGGALGVLDRLKNDFNLDIDSHTAAGGSQIRGASGGSLAEILERFGETRPLLSEGGRTNRGLRGDIQSLLEAFQESNLSGVPRKVRNGLLDDLQRFLVQKVQEFHGRQRIPTIYDRSNTAWKNISGLLEAAQAENKEGAVAEYLVGAKLALRFPNHSVRNKSFSSADVQAGESGDFKVGDTIFHVTVAPMPALFDKCKRNLADGFRVYVVVPERVTIGARQNAEQAAAGKIHVVSIESLVSQNIEEIAEFSADRVRDGFYRLFSTYNERVNAIENDKSLLLEIPKNLIPRPSR